MRNTSEDVLEGAPSLKTYMFNGLLQTPFPIGGVAAVRDRRRRDLPASTLTPGPEDISETHVGINVGGGVKINLLGPLRLRLDYRVLKLNGSPLHSNPNRFYAGLI